MSPCLVSTAAWNGEPQFITNHGLQSTCVDKVAQLARCRTSNQKVADSIPGLGTFSWSVLGQDSSFHIASVYPAAKWVPSINKAVLRACALYAASCSGISPQGIEMVSMCTRVNISVDYNPNTFIFTCEV